MAWNEAVVTAAGMELLVRCLTGGSIVITRAVGGERVSAALSLMALKSIGEPCHEMKLFRIENEGERIIVNLRVQNKGLEEEYTLRQIGLFARLEDDDSDVLFAIIQDSVGEVIPRESDNPEFLTEFDFVIPVANGEKIQVEITPGTFATAEDLAETEKELGEHISDKGNPHGVTKAQVGLGNVPDVATNDQTPTYGVSANMSELSSGEKLSAAFGKLAKAVKELIEHIGDNVRHITAAERTAWNGKAAGNHTHSAADVGALTNIQIGTVTTGAAGSNASASASTSGTVTTMNLTIPKGDKGDTGTTGTAAGFGTPTATVDANVGTPSVTVTASGANTAKVFNFAFKNLKGAKGDKGDKGDPGTNATTTAVATTSAAGLMSAADKTKLNNTQSILSIAQGTVSSLTFYQGGYYIPNNDKATKVLVEYWTDKSFWAHSSGDSSSDSGRQKKSASNYASRYMTGISPSMTAIDSSNILSALDAIKCGVDRTGRPYFSGNFSSTDNYRVTWYS